MINIIGNAIKFTYKGYIEINVNLDELYDNNVLNFSIRDTGIGIESVILYIFYIIWILFLFFKIE